LDAGAVGSGRVSLLACLALLDVAGGRFDDATASISAAEAMVDEHTLLDVRRWLTAAAVECAIWQGDAAGALARLALAVADTKHPPVVTPAARPAMLDASRPHLLALGARACADAALAERAAGQDAGVSSLARGQVEDSLARAEVQGALAEVWSADLALARAELTRGGDAAARVAGWRLARERLEGRPYPWAYAGWRLAEALLAQRDGRDDAAAALASAQEAAERLGAAPLVAECTGLARRARLDLAGPSAAEPDGREAEVRAFGLTQREAEVLALLAQGLANQEIAERLFISPKTASVHVSNIYGKLGVESRVAAATLAHEMGLDRLPDEES
jgi:ATP/maltotriose-dependent transcriptional regulator MalT